MITFQMVWPESRGVTESEMRQWAEDAIANKEIDGPSDLPIEELIKQMNDAGLITANPYGSLEPYETPYDEDAYQAHIANEGPNAWNENPDGCWFCGGDHHSDCCPERY